MNLQPHVIVMHWIRSEFKRLLSQPEYLTFSLAGYGYTPALASTYGAKFIDNAIKWLRLNEKSINYCLGYRFDTSRLPSVAVTISGGSETKQIIGDYAGKSIVDADPIVYTTFHASNVEEGKLVIPSEYKIENKLWRGLYVVRNQEPPREIVDLLKESDDADLKLIADRPFLLQEGLSDWKVISASNHRQYVIGSSLDRVEIKIYLDIPGDPELCEVMSSVMRSALKNARLHLSENGLNEVSISYGSIGKNESYAGINVWTAEFTISALMTDRWLMGDSTAPEQMGIIFELERNV